MTLFCFAEHNGVLRNRIASNFVARGMSCLDSILLVWRGGCEQDAWILHRTLVDRLFHLHALAENDNFQNFEDYSFKKKYEARHRLLSDSDQLMREKLPASLKELQSSDRDRYREIKKSGLEWHRPKAKDVAKEMDLHFLYTLGYDYASTHVHPMADDGEGDFQRLISPTQSISLKDTTVLRNSLVAQVVLTQQAFNVSHLRWRQIAFDFLDGIQSFLYDRSAEYKITFVKMANAWPEFTLCKPKKGET